MKFSLTNSMKCRFAQTLMLIQVTATVYLRPFKHRPLSDKSDSEKKDGEAYITCKENRLEINIPPCAGKFCLLINGEKRTTGIKDQTCAPNTLEIVSLCNMYSLFPASL